jgi:hypothetical protein
MAVLDTRTELNNKLNEYTDHITTGLSGIGNEQTETTVEEILKGGTPDWYSHPEDYKAMVQDDYSRAKENSDNLVREYKFPHQQRFTDPARMVNRITLKDFQVKLRKNGLTCWSVESPRHDGTGGLWVMADTVSGSQPQFVTTVQYPAMYEWSILREDNHGLPAGEKYIGWRNAVARLIELKIWTEEKANKVFGYPLLGEHTIRYRQNLWNMRNNRPSTV